MSPILTSAYGRGARYAPHAVTPRFVPQVPKRHRLQFPNTEPCFPTLCDQAGAEWRGDFWCVYRESREYLKERQDEELRVLEHRHELQSLDLARKLRALHQVEKREQRSLEESMLREVRVSERGGKNHAPSMGLKLTPRGRPAAPHKAKNRYTSEMAREKFSSSAKGGAQKELDLHGDFARASGKEDSEGKSSGDGKALKPQSSERKQRHSRRNRRDLDRGR